MAINSGIQILKNIYKISNICKAPKVIIDKDVINFGLCHMGDGVAQTFQITNYLPLSVSVQVY